MSDLYASVAGVRAVSASLTVSTYGACGADVWLATSDAVPNQVTITISNLSMVCNVVRSDIFAGQRRLRLVGGHGGWSTQVAPRAYSNPTGIPLSLILRDAASDVGETVNVANDVIVGNYYVREAAPASRVLRQLSGRQWWIDSAGVTQVGTRPATPVTTPFLVDQYDGGHGLMTIATEDIAAWLPGASFSNDLVGQQTVSTMTVDMSADGKLRLQVLTGGTDDRTLRGFRDLVRDEGPTDTFRGVWEYSVTSSKATNGAVTFDGYPTASTAPLPAAVGWPIAFGVPGSTSVPAAGSRVLVAFANADPTRPVVIGFTSDAASALTVDGSTISLGAGLGRVLREGDTLTLTGVQSGAGATGVTATVTIGLGAPPAPSRVKA